MAVDAQDLLAPPDGRGEIDLALFPGESAGAVKSRLLAYLETGYAEADAAGVTDDATKDRVAFAAAHAAAFRAIAHRMYLRASSTTIDGEGSESYASDQRKYWLDRATEQRDLVASLLGSGVAGGVATTLPSQSHSMTFVW